MDKKEAKEKKEVLYNYLKRLPFLMVAFSGGADSSFLLAAAREALGERVLAVTAHSAIHSKCELDHAVDFAKSLGVEHVVFESCEMNIEEFSENGPDRCYHCKKALAKSFKDIADQRGIKFIAHAINMDDFDDFRPGIRAAQEAGLIAPLAEAGLNKEEIRFLSREMGLETWNMPSNACLASRIPYGSDVTVHKLRMVDDAEIFLKKKGFTQARVRHHGSVARIEVNDSDIECFLEKDLRREVVEFLKNTGFCHVAIDLEGYVSGSMNRVFDFDETEE